MPDGKNLTGKKFGKLTVIKNTGQKDKWGSYLWLCKCDCGNYKKVKAYRLTTNNPKNRTRSCGCLRKLSKGESSFNDLCHYWRKSAKRKGLIWNLTKEQTRKLSKGNCHYCGVKPSQTHLKRGANGAYIYNGIDRVNNNKGYTSTNCVPCCRTCNYMKSDYSIREFRTWLRKVCKHLFCSNCHYKKLGCS